MCKKTITILLSIVILFLFGVVSGSTEASSEQVAVWMSNVSGDDTGMNLALTSQQGAVFAPDSSSAPYTIYVDETITDQTIDGFGASLTDASAWLMYQHLRGDLDMEEEYDELMTQLFDKTYGIGLSFLRQPMGSCDYARTWYSYDDMGGTLTDPGLTYFSIAHDLDYIIPCLQDALDVNPGRVKIMASPWSPPGWMKNNNNLSGGGDATFNTQYYSAYANYFVKFIQAYEAEGVPIWAVTPQNEPGYATANYPSMRMSSDIQTDFIGDYLGPAFDTNGINSKIMCYDHNWNEPGSNYIRDIYGDAVAEDYIVGSGWHWYGGDYTAAYDIHYEYPDKGMWMTEGSSGDWYPCYQWRQGFINEMECLLNYVRVGCQSIVFWNMALDQNRAPHLLDNNCRGLVMINSNTGDIVYNTDYYAMGHFSKFVDPGAVRIYSSEFSKDLDTAAFKNPDGSKVLVAFNVAATSKVMKVKWGSQSFSYVIPGETAVTFRWSGAQSGATVKDARLQLEANSYDGRDGYVRPALCEDDAIQNGSSDGECLGYIANGDYTLYSDMDFGSGVDTFTARVAANSNGAIQLRLDSPTGTVIGTMNVEAGGGYQSWTTQQCSISNASGVHDLYLVYSTSGYNLHWFSFSIETPGINNLVANPGFETDGTETQTPSGWGEWQNTSASYVEDLGPHSGGYNLAHWNMSSYEVATYQDFSGLDNGLYTLKAWARSSGGQIAAYMSAKNYGGSELTVAIPTGNEYTQITIPNISVSNGQCSITFYSNAHAEEWINVDEVEFYKQ